jgi:hypothetical protein
MTPTQFSRWFPFSWRLTASPIRPRRVAPTARVDCSTVGLMRAVGSVYTPQDLLQLCDCQQGVVLPHVILLPDASSAMLPSCSLSLPDQAFASPSRWRTDIVGGWRRLEFSPRSVCHLRVHMCLPGCGGHGHTRSSVTFRMKQRPRRVTFLLRQRDSKVLLLDSERAHAHPCALTRWRYHQYSTATILPPGSSNSIAA